MIAAVVLAGGESRRMGRPKLLLKLGETTLLTRAVRVARAAADEVVVVVGAYAAAYAAEAEAAGARVVANPGWREGLAASLRAGILALGPEVEAALVVLPDQPRVTGEHLRALVEAHRRTGAPLVFSRYEGTLGAPALVHRALFPEVLRLEGDRGMRAFVGRGYPLAEVPMDANPDVDTPLDAERLGLRLEEG